jgi:hypothetical protein
MMTCSLARPVSQEEVADVIIAHLMGWW